MLFRYLLVAVLAVRIAGAHLMHQSAVWLDFHPDRVDAEVQLPIDRLSISFGTTVDEQSFATLRAGLRDYVQAHVHPVSNDGRPFAVRIESMDLQTVEGSPYVVAHLVMTPPKGESASAFHLRYDVITHEIVTHVVLVSQRSPGDPKLIGWLRGEVKSIVIDRNKKA